MTLPFSLEYSWLTMLCKFQVYNKGIQLCVYIYVFILQILFPYRLLQNIEYISLCYTVGFLSILYIVVCIC